MTSTAISQEIANLRVIAGLTDGKTTTCVKCGEPFTCAADVYRCIDCDALFHKPCLKQHCEHEILKLRDVPLCSNHAAAWFTARHFRPGECWFCEQGSGKDVMNIAQAIKAEAEECAKSAKDMRNTPHNRDIFHVLSIVLNGIADKLENGKLTDAGTKTI